MRNGDMWSDVRRQIAADTARRGGTATEQEGDFGTELFCERTVKTDDGATATQPSRIVGINGPRWFPRATFFGRPAVAADAAGPWNQAIRSLVVRRGEGPTAPGAPPPIGGASGRESVGHCVYLLGVAVSIQKKNKSQ